jgi:uncharacterized protein
MRRNDPPETPRAPRARKGRSFDAFELVQQRATLRGSVAATALPRLADRVADDGGRIDYAIGGTTDAADRPALDIAIDGELRLTCQRCLKPMRWPASQRIVVLLAHDARELAQLDDCDEHEVVLADAPLDPLELVEDELLLAMPYAPRHSQEQADQCVQQAADADAAAKPPSPFGALAGLKARADKRAKR